jgi:hypothetical protein
MWNKTKKLLKIFFDDLKKSDVSNIAGNLAFNSVLSIVPILAVFYSVFEHFGFLKDAYDKIYNEVLQLPGMIAFPPATNYLNDIEYSDITAYNFIQTSSKNIYIVDFEHACLLDNEYLDWFVDEFLNGINIWNPDQE